MWEMAAVEALSGSIRHCFDPKHSSIRDKRALVAPARVYAEGSG